MAGKVKVRVLYPTAFQQRGYETRTLKKVKSGDKEVTVEILGEQIEVMDVDSVDAADFIAAGYAEKVGEK